MLNTRILILLLVLSVRCLFPQQDSIVGQSKSTVTELSAAMAVAKCNDLLLKYKTIGDVVCDIDTMSMTRLKGVMRILYDASEKDPITAFADLMRLTSIHRMQSARGSDVQPEYCNPFHTLYKFEDKIDKEFPRPFTDLIRTHYFLTATIKSITNSRLNLGDYYQGEIGVVNTINFAAEVKEVIKGETRFKVGDEVKFYYIPFWRETSWDFSVGETYFLPLDVIAPDEKDYSWICLDVSDGRYSTNGSTIRERSFGCFPIINGELIDRVNYYGFGSKVKWIEFRDNFLKAINEVKTW